MALLELAGVVHTFGEITALGGIDLRVDSGEVVGLLGHNGAGKTTTVRVLAGLLPVDEGTVRVTGLDPAVDGAAVRRTVAVLPARPSLSRARLGPRLG
jgi:ABC-type multidrug transport system ATPase subunit